MDAAATILATLSFCASATLVFAAYKAHAVLRSTPSRTFLASSILIAVALCTTIVQNTLLSQEFLRILYDVSILGAYTLLLLAVEKTTTPGSRVLALIAVFQTSLLAITIPVITHVVAIILLSLLAHKFYRNFLQKNSTNALLVYVAFIVLLLSHLTLLFSFTTLFSSMLQLLAFFLLFSMLWRIARI